MHARRRTGILGGTFDPVHEGHLAIARGVLEVGPLDRVLLMPVGAPAHRETHASALDRAAMVRLAVEGGDARLQFDGTALDQPAPAYTADTLALAHAAYPDDSLYFIAGADSIAHSVWRRLDEVAALVERFYIIPRRGSSWSDVESVIGSLDQSSRARFTPLELSIPDISSSEIRTLVAGKRSIRGLVPREVERYIERRGLYR